MVDHINVYDLSGRTRYSFSYLKIHEILLACLLTKNKLLRIFKTELPTLEQQLQKHCRQRY